MKIQPRKRFGQHWLKDSSIIDRILQAADLQPTDRILEIGPGTGILTRPLLDRVASVLSVEIDRDLQALLSKNLASRPNFHLVGADFLNLNLNDYPRANKVVANIPYNITAPILEKLLGTIANPHHPPYDSITLLVQKEIAERLLASPSTKAYGALGVRMRYLAVCDYIHDVPPRSFSPPPKVDSSVIRLTPRTYPEKVDRPKQLETLIKLGFANRRKMLRNNLKGVIDGGELTRVLTELDIKLTCRAEELSLDLWIALSNKLNIINIS